MTNLQQQIKNDSLKEILSIARKMQNSEIDLLEGSRSIFRLKNNLENPEDEVFNIFTLVVSDADKIPDKKIRDNFSKNYLSEMDKEKEEYISAMKDKIIQACGDILVKFSQ